MNLYHSDFAGSLLSCYAVVHGGFSVVSTPVRLTGVSCTTSIKLACLCCLL